MSKRIIATYHNSDEADAAIDRLVRVGYPSEDISVITTLEERRADGKSKSIHQPNVHELDLTSGAAGGSLVGGTLGLIIAGAFAATATATGGTDASTATEIASLAGPFAAALVGGGAGAAAGAFAGGAFGFLRGQGAAQDHDENTSLRDIMVAVDTDGMHTAAIRSLLNSKTTVTQDF